MEESSMRIDDLPVGWEQTHLRDVCEIILGQSPPSETYNTVGKGLPFFQGKAEFTELHPVAKKWCSVPGKIAEQNDILLSVRAPVGSTNIADRKCCIGRGLAALRFNNHKLLFYYLRHIEKELDKKGTGSTFKAISGDIVRNVDFPLPPLHEQHRIVAKIEELFSELDKGVEALKTAQQQLKVYRQAVLKWAFEGKYSVSLNTWEKLRLRDVVESYQNGLAKRQSSVGQPFNVLRLSDIRKWEINSKEMRKIKLSEQEINKYSLIKDDILTIRVNGTKDLVGRLIPYKGNDDLAFCDHFIRIKLKPKIYSQFLKYVSEGNTFRRFIELNMVSSAGQNTISQSTLNDIDLKLPPFEEQIQIVQQIETRLSVADKLEETITQSLQQAEALRQSILKQAFAGQLVPQDPNDEPAAKLLERIKAERAVQTPVNGTLKRRSARRKAASFMSNAVGKP